VLHIGYLKYGSLSVGDEVVSTYEELRRWPIRNNHSATHILNFALKKVIGDGVDQKGSLVAEEKFRFDYAAKGAPTPKQLEEIESITNDFIERNLKVYSKEVPLAIGKSITGLRAVFGEVYPDPVRVVTVGFDIEEILKDTKNLKWAETSIEFCGGTHVSKTGDIKRFVVVEESAIAKGIRRIVGVTGEEAFKLQKQADEHSRRLLDLSKLQGADLESGIKIYAKYLDEATLPAVRKNKLREEFDLVKTAFAAADKVKKTKEAKEVLDIVTAFFETNPGESVFVKAFSFGNSKAIAQAITTVKGLGSKSALFLDVDSASGKVAQQSIVSKSQIEKGLKANEWAQAVAEVIGGRSGGKEDAAMGAGTETSKVQEAVLVAETFAKRFVS